MLTDGLKSKVIGISLTYNISENFFFLFANISFKNIDYFYGLST